MTPPPAVACAESIALLALLHTVPTLPSCNPTNDAHSHRRGYVLSFERERSLAGVLAFLSSMDDDRAESGDGNQVLGQLERGFERIFAELAQISDGTHA